MKKKNEVIAFLGKGTTFEGKMSFHGTTRIDGHFKGEIAADGNLIISNQGLVEADVHASSIMISGAGPGRIEVMKKQPEEQCHVAIHVSDIDAAAEDLQRRGVELEQPIVKPEYQVIYLKERDPAGNRVHLYWRP